MLKEQQIPVPCGKCPACISRRTSGWSFRLMQEDKRASSALFVTLTYDTDHVPITNNGFMSLQKKDVQLFFKRLRKLEKNKLKYYLAGEYGGKFKRPHYHIILFNAFIDPLAFKNCSPRDIHPKYTNISKAWTLGSIQQGTVTAASVGYTLKYISKDKRPTHKNDDRVSEFQLMSKGLGSNYLTEAMINWHKSDLINRMYCNIELEKKISMPRYYKQKLYDEYELFLIQQKAKEDQSEYYAEMQKKYGDDWEQQLKMIAADKFRQMYKKSLQNQTL